MNRMFWLFLLPGLLGAGNVFAASDLSTWKFVKHVNVPPLSVAGYVKVVLDTDVFMGARTDLADLRVVSDGVREVPYQLIVEDEQVRNTYTQSVLSNLSARTGETMFMLDLEQDGNLHDHLVINSDSKNFKRRVEVAASDVPLPLSSSKWRVLTTEGYIYNFHDDTSGFDAGSGEVHYPVNTSRYLRVTIGKGEGDHVDVSGAHVYRLTNEQVNQQSVSRSVTITENKERRTSELLVDVGGQGIPTRAIILHTSEPQNFSRRVVAESSSDKKNWTAVGEGYLFAVQTELFSGKQLSLPYRETRDRYIRVIVVNEDDAPVQWDTQADVVSVPRSVVFAVDPGHTYGLYYGKEMVNAPHYDLARYFQYIEAGTITGAMLGEHEVNPAFISPVIPAPKKDYHLVLNSILVLLTGLVSFLTIAHLKKLKLSKRGPPEGDLRV